MAAAPPVMRVSTHAGGHRAPPQTVFRLNRGEYAGATNPEQSRLPSSNTSLENLLCVLLINEWLDERRPKPMTYASERLSTYRHATSYS